MPILPFLEAPVFEALLLRHRAAELGDRVRLAVGGQLDHDPVERTGKGERQRVRVADRRAPVASAEEPTGDPDDRPGFRQLAGSDAAPIDQERALAAARSGPRELEPQGRWAA